MKIRIRAAAAVGLGIGMWVLVAQGATDTASTIREFQVRDGKARLKFSPAPASDEYKVLSSPKPEGPYTTDATGALNGFDWEGGTDGVSKYFRVESRPLSPEKLEAVNLLNRIAYGPTPDELEHVLKIGADAYIEEQLAPEKIEEDLDAPKPFKADWKKATVTGVNVRSNPGLYIYSTAGEVLVDDVRLVLGSVDDGTRTNLVRNGDFSTGLTPAWTVTDNVSGSAVTTEDFHTGGSALRLICAENGGSSENALVQTVTLANGATATLSFWYRTSRENETLVVRLGGAAENLAQAVRITVGTGPVSSRSPAAFAAKLEDRTAVLGDLRGWHLQRAVQSKRQLVEVMRQFWENHFVTEYSKVKEYMDGRYDNNLLTPLFSTMFEYRENKKWEAVMLNPKGTFHQLLKISAESPAMIIYLDTVRSGRNKATPNENYARELCELFAYGVDNGYDQKDIVEISRVWAGWSVDMVETNQLDNPFAREHPRKAFLAAVDDGETNNIVLLTNAHTWSLRWRTNYQAAGKKDVFFEHDAAGKVTGPKVVPARFGPPWAGRAYGITLNGGAGTNGMSEGYQLIAHMADQPFTQEYISVKLCNLLVHDGFAHGYDFTDDESTPEEELIHDCMMAWENPPNGGPRGQIRDVLRVILKSPLFRSHLALGQKVKTPLEFAVSSVRALRTVLESGESTAELDEAKAVVSAGFLNRAGRMRLFDRAEPDGYPEEASAWISAGTLTERIRFAQSASSRRGSAEKSDNCGANTVIHPVELLKSRNINVSDARAVAEYLVTLVFPGEGGANLAGYRSITERLLNTDIDGKTESPLSALGAGSVAHDTRIRSVVGWLLSTPRFQEQ